jgi:ABC-type multidrug transport system fused ATPase/permease subunit
MAECRSAGALQRILTSFGVARRLTYWLYLEKRDAIWRRVMFKRSSTVIMFILVVVVIAVAMLYVAYGFVSTAPNKDSPTFLFWLEVAKPIIQLLYITLGGGIVAGLLKVLFDSVQARRQVEAAKDQFRKDLINGFVNARYEATGKRDKFLNAPSPKLEGLYRSMMEDEFIVVKERLSRVWHDVETGKQSLTYSEEIKGGVIAMKEFFDQMLVEYRSVKDSHVPDAMEFFENLPSFGDFLKEGDHFESFLSSYRTTLSLVRLDLLGPDYTPGPRGSH